MRKILVIRFSSIGDIVLTTPVIRCLREQLPGHDIHFVTKKSFLPVIQHNPHLHKIHVFDKDIEEIGADLQREKFDFVLDLHRNLRSARLKRLLGAPSASFNKINFRKFLAVYFKMKGLLPPVHIVQRYLEAASALGVNDDGKGLEYFIAPQDEIHAGKRFFNRTDTPPFIALVIGGSYHTKKIPFNKLVEIVQQARLPVVLMGGPSDLHEGRLLQEKFPALINTCGELNISQSASVIRQSAWVITSDTGLMHIAAAFNKKIISAWGNTIPEFGMSVYQPRPENKILEVKGLSCRPCSKLGYGRCPLGHFKCMEQISYDFVKDLD